MRSWSTRRGAAEELCEALGIDYEGLADELSRFNPNAEAGVGSVFHCSEFKWDVFYSGDNTGRTDLANPCLAPVATGPFYGCLYLNGTYGTTGGLLTDGKARMIDRDGNVIPRLYATGTCGTFVCGEGYGGLSLIHI